VAALKESELPVKVRTKVEPGMRSCGRRWPGRGDWPLASNMVVMGEVEVI
jgi:hypothetical protein